MTLSGRPLLVVARPYDLSDVRYDGFVTRRLRVLRVLRRNYHLTLLLLRNQTDRADVHPDYVDSVWGEVRIASHANSRWDRLKTAATARTRAGEDARSEILRALTETGVQAAVTFGPWLDVEFEPVFAALPTLHFFEEDLTQMSEIAPQSVRARIFRRLELALLRHVAHHPHTVVVIALKEGHAALRRYDANLLWHPYLLDPSEFPTTPRATQGDTVLVVGQFGQPRNAEGLRDILRELSTTSFPPPVTVVSGSPVHKILSPYVKSGLISVEIGLDDLMQVYQTSRLSLVPARRVSGIKTTVLQAWAAGSPVVCFSSIAESVGPFAHTAVAAGPDPVTVASEVLRVYADEGLRQRLVQRGRDNYVRYFAAESKERELLAVVAELFGDRSDSRRSRRQFRATDIFPTDRAAGH